MRNNTRLIVAYLVSLMLVNFYGNLAIKTQALKKRRRELDILDWIEKFGNFIGKLIRNVFTFAFKIIVGLVSIFLGLIFAGIWIVLATLMTMGADRSGWKSVKTCIALVKDGAKDIWDSGRALFSTEDNKHYEVFTENSYKEYNDRDRGYHYYYDRQLSQSVENGQPFLDTKQFDCSAQTRLSPAEVLQDNLQDNFDSNRQLIVMTKRVFEINMFIRTDYFQKKTDETQDIDKHKQLAKESSDNRINIIKNKSKLFKNRIRRSVCGMVYSFMKVMEKESKPEFFEGDKKKNYDKYVLELKAAKDADAKKKAEDKIRKLNKYDPINSDHKKDAEKALKAELTKYGITDHDLSCQYTTMAIKTAFEAKNAAQMAELAKQAPADAQAEIGLDEVKKDMEKNDKFKGTDDTEVLVGDIQEDEEKDQTKEQL